MIEITLTTGINSGIDIAPAFVSESAGLITYDLVVTQTIVSYEYTYYEIVLPSAFSNLAQLSYSLTSTSPISGTPTVKLENQKLIIEAYTYVQTGTFEIQVTFSCNIETSGNFDNASITLS